MPPLLDVLRRDYPSLTFAVGKQFYWSPKSRTVHYNPNALSTDKGSWSLLHEISHAVLGHSNFSTDFELLSMERDAWQHAVKISNKYGLHIKDDHIQNCLDSYREWLYLRSTCPACTNAGLQIKNGIYRCINCNNLWSVSRSRFCRSYRINHLPVT